MLYFLRAAILFITKIISSALASTAVQCTYGSHRYELLNDIYQCSVSSINIATQDPAQFSSVKGIHEGIKTNDDVIGFRAVGQNIQFFPLGLQQQFPSIKVIHLENCPLKQLRQSDLLDYKNLEYLCIFNSDLSIIDDGTFDFNPELQLINFGSNKFLNIDPSAFRSLSKLTNLYLHSVPCIGRFTRDRNGVKDILLNLETKCKDPEYLSLHQKFKFIESRSKNEDIKEDLKVFEQEFKSSGFSDNPSLKTRLEALTKIGSSVTQIRTKDNQKPNL